MLSQFPEEFSPTTKRRNGIYRVFTNNTVLLSLFIQASSQQNHKELYIQNLFVTFIFTVFTHTQQTIHLQDRQAPLRAGKATSQLNRPTPRTRQATSKPTSHLQDQTADPQNKKPPRSYIIRLISEASHPENQLSDPGDDPSAQRRPIQSRRPTNRAARRPLPPRMRPTNPRGRWPAECVWSYFLDSISCLFCIVSIRNEVIFLIPLSIKSSTLSFIFTFRFTKPRVFSLILLYWSHFRSM